MRTRRDILTASYDMGTSGTVTFNVDYSDPISQLLVSFDATNGATSNKNNPIERNISKIELVDGSKVVWSLPGDVAYGLYHTFKGGKIIERYSGAISDGQWVTIPLQFGRFPYDPVYALNPVAFRNLQLKITFDEATVRAAGATGFVSDSFTCTIGVDLMEDAIPPAGYLMAKDVYDYTSLVSGDTQVDMPTDYPWRALILRVYESGQWWGTNISNLKLQADGGKYIPFDLSSAEFEYFVAERFPLNDKEIYTVADNGDTQQGWLGLAEVCGAYHHSTAHIIGASSYSGNYFTWRIYTDAGVAANAQTVHAYLRGRFPQNTLILPFGRLDVLEDAFQAQQYGNLKLYLTNGNAGAEVDVGVQQVVTY